ncbi:MAG: carbon-nitrogen hydrolase family protein [Chitinispirillaceae bacterium]
MRVAVAQISCTVGQGRANLKTIADHVRQAADKGCRLIAFPEMSDTGYVMDVISQHAGTRPGYFYDGICSLAADHDMYVACGMSERVGEKVFNSLLVAGPDGTERAWYRKVHLFASGPVYEQNVFSAGDRLSLVNIDSIQCGLMICYDLRFPEQARALMQKGAEALIIVSAWPHARAAHWRLLTKARAVENQLWVLSSNRCGTDNGLKLAGSSGIIDPWGEIQVAAPESGEGIFCTDISLKSVTETRHRFPVLTHRRPDVYT